ncbi:MAG: hypothetical protein OXH65_07090 [Paracoccaceae bacterium]|nr:hypothetical protein [Paracoccaceae bacterium]MDE2674857.1 hypothetical protein [Paracoccaceae bacterium]
MELNEQNWSWIWPDVGAGPISQDNNSEMFDRNDYPYTDTFVREAIQNSLDARLDTNKPVIMNFNFHEDILDARKCFINDLILFRKKAGLTIPEKWDNGIFNWLVVEDFNTSGLLGDLQDRGSDFWNYWLNFGLSNKDGSGRGGRGIGRVTFLIASSIQSVIGFTRRYTDQKKVVCGMSVLKAGQYKNEFKNTHAYLVKEIDKNIFELHNSSKFFKQVEKEFGFTGFDNDHLSGFGLAILYPFKELTPEGILASTIEHFAPAIINKDLVVSVDYIELNDLTIREIAHDVKDKFKNNSIKYDVSRYLDFLVSASSPSSQIQISLKNSGRDALEDYWRSNSIKIEKIKDQILQQKKVSMRIKFPLTKRSGNEIVFLNAVIRSTPDGSYPIDQFFREGMSLPDVKSKSPGNLDLVMLVPEGELATYLNFCEGKAHLDLLENKEITLKLRDKGYIGVTDVKRLIKSFPTKLRNLVTPETKTPDSTTFRDFFPMNNKSHNGGQSGPNTDPRGKPWSPIPGKNGEGGGRPISPRKPTKFIISEFEDGAKIHAKPEFDEWPEEVNISFSYADGTRNPTWSPYDFKLADLKVVSKNCSILINNNILTVKNSGQDTEITVTGFDTNRELDIQLNQLD